MTYLFACSKPLSSSKNQNAHFIIRRSIHTELYFQALNSVALPMPSSQVDEQPDVKT